MIELASDMPRPELNRYPKIEIQGLTLIGICGHAGAGKDTVAEYLNDKYERCYRRAFADPLKYACAKLFGIPIWKFYADGIKEDIDPHWRVSPRMVAQFVGTELVRDHMWKLLPGIEAEDFWIHRFASIINGKADNEDEDEETYDAEDTIVIPDLRFQNEYEFLCQNKALIIHLTRDVADGNIGIQGHRSEGTIHFNYPDQTYHIPNNGTKEELYALVDKAMVNTLF